MDEIPMHTCTGGDHDDRGECREIERSFSGKAYDKYPDVMQYFRGAQWAVNATGAPLVSYNGELRSRRPQLSIRGDTS